MKLNKIFLSLSLICLLSCQVSLAIQIPKVITDLLDSNILSQEKKELSQQFLEMTHISERVSDIFDDLKCKSCEAFSTVLEHVPETGVVSVLDFLIEFICYDTKKIGYPVDVCKDMIARMGPIVIQSTTGQYLAKGYICGELLKVCAPTYQYLSTQAYINRVLSEINENTQQQWPTPSQKKTYKMLHITDTHVDLYYQEGTNANCIDPLCCRDSSGQPSTPDFGAKHWGGHPTCDTPLKTFEAFANYFRRAMQQDTDFAIWTGDFKPHDVWNSYPTETIDTGNQTAQVLYDQWQNFQVYPTLGNHEPYPVNTFDFSGNRNTSYITDAYSQIWQKWLGDDGAAQVKNWGYYTKQVPGKNLKLISMHTNAGNDQNFYLMRDPTDPGNMLAWLENELIDAEKNNQTVFIIGHMPGDSQLELWEARYKALIQRYTYTVRGQFFGHRHDDSFILSTSYNNSNETTGIQFIPGSITTYADIPQYPSFRIYEIDEETNIPVNYQNYYMNLTYYNSLQSQVDPSQVDFYLGYDFQKDYGYPDMSLQSFTHLRDSLKSDLGTLQTFMFNRHQGTPESYEAAQKAKLSSNGIGEYCSTFDLNSQQTICQGGDPKDGIVVKLMGKWKEIINQ